MTEIRWATPIAKATTIAESEWKRHLEEARAVFKTWEKVYPRGTELNWTLYSARQGIPSLLANHVWKNTQNRRMVLVPNDQYLRASTVKMKRPNVNSPSEVTPNASTGRQRSNPTRSRGHGGHLGAMAAILAAIL